MKAPCPAGVIARVSAPGPRMRSATAGSVAAVLIAAFSRPR
jgi:hypothetical protein